MPGRCIYSYLGYTGSRLSFESSFPSSEDVSLIPQPTLFYGTKINVSDFSVSKRKDH